MSENNTSFSIRNWSVQDRPRERFQKLGSRNISDTELLAIIIGSGSKNESALELAKIILKSYQNNLIPLSQATIDELCKFKGIGPTKAISICSAFELGKRAIQPITDDQIKITSSQDAYKIFKPALENLNREEFWILLLNRSNRLIESICISQGGISGTVTDVRLILKKALDKLASGIILGHNHPSGNINPSDADREITHKIKEASQLMDIKVLDHIIVTNQSYFSFADEGYI